MVNSNLCSEAGEKSSIYSRYSRYILMANILFVWESNTSPLNTPSGQTWPYGWLCDSVTGQWLWPGSSSLGQAAYSSCVCQADLSPVTQGGCVWGDHSSLFAEVFVSSNGRQRRKEHLLNPFPKVTVSLLHMLYTHSLKTAAAMHGRPLFLL